VSEGEQLGPRFPPSTGELLREVLAMGAPIIAAMSSSTIMQFVDFWMVAQVGKAETAAVAPAGIAVFTLTSFLMGLARCTNTFVAQCFGRQEHGKCGAYAWQGLYVALAAGVVALGFRPLAPGLFRLMGHEPALQALEVTYFRIVLLTIGFVTANVTIASFFQAIGRPAVPMFITFVANAVNVGLNYVLIFGKLGLPALGLEGAALATVLATALQTGLLLAVFLRPGTSSQFGTRVGWRWSWLRTKQLLRIGLPAGLSFSLDIACWAVFIGFVVGRFGAEQLASSNVASQIINLSFLPALGMGAATTALVGQYIGRDDPQGARLRSHMALKLTMLYMCTMGVIFLTFRRRLVGLFSAEETVITLGSQILVLAALFQIFDAIGIVMAGALRGAGDTRWPAVVTVSYSWLFFLPSSYFFGHVLGYRALGGWLAATLYVMLYGLTMWWRFESGRWEKIDIFLGQKSKQDLSSEALAKEDDVAGPDDGASTNH